MFLRRRIILWQDPWRRNASLNARNHLHAAALLEVAGGVRGHGPVKAESIRAASRREEELTAVFLDPPDRAAA